LELWRLPQNRRFYGKMKCLCLSLRYIGEKVMTLSKTYGIKARCYWEHPWETHWEPRERKNEENPPPLIHPKLQRKNIKAL